MGFVNIKIKEEFAGDLINSLYDDLEAAAKEIVEKNAEIERARNAELIDQTIDLKKELEEKDTMIEKLGKYHLELEQKHEEAIKKLELENAELKKKPEFTNSSYVERLEAERDKLMKLITNLQEENASYKIVAKMQGSKVGRPKKA